MKTLSGSRASKFFPFPRTQSEQHYIDRNSYPVARIPPQTKNVKKIFLKLLGAPVFGELGHGVPYKDYANDFILVFDITSMEEAFHDYLYCNGKMLPFQLAETFQHN